MVLRLHLVVLQRVQDLRVVGRGDHPIEHAQDVLLHRMRFVYVLEQLRFQLVHRVEPPQSETADLTPEHRGVSKVAAVLRLEPVDEHRERRPVVELEAAYVERHPRKARKFRCSAPAVDPLDAAVQRRQRAGDAVDRPDPIELAHAK